MDRVLISSREDPRIADFLSLRDGSKKDEAIFIADGMKSIQGALNAGLIPLEFLLDGELEDYGFSPAKQVILYQLAKSELKKVPGHGHHQGVMAKFPIPPFLKSLDQVQTPCLILDGLSNSENCGLIMRTASAFGIKSFILSQNCSHPFLRRSVRVSMGGVFALSFFQSLDLVQDLLQLKKQGVLLLGIEQHKDAIDLREFSLAQQNCGFIFGSEAKGVERKILEVCDHILEIKHGKSVDSLNVAQAVTLGLYTLLES